MNGQSVDLHRAALCGGDDVLQTVAAAGVVTIGNYNDDAVDWLGLLGIPMIDTGRVQSVVHICSRAGRSHPLDGSLEIGGIPGGVLPKFDRAAEGKHKGAIGLGPQYLLQESERDRFLLCHHLTHRSAHVEHQPDAQGQVVDALEALELPHRGLVVEDANVRRRQVLHQPSLLVSHTELQLNFRDGLADGEFGSEHGSAAWCGGWGRGDRGTACHARSDTACTDLSAALVTGGIGGGRVEAAGNPHANPGQNGGTRGQKHTCGDVGTQHIKSYRPFAAGASRRTRTGGEALGGEDFAGRTPSLTKLGATATGFPSAGLTMWYTGRHALPAPTPAFPMRHSGRSCLRRLSSSCNRFPGTFRTICSQMKMKLLRSATIRP